MLHAQQQPNKKKSYERLHKLTFLAAERKKKEIHNVQKSKIW